MTAETAPRSAIELTPIQQVHVKLHQARLELDPRNFLDMGRYLEITEQELEGIRDLIGEAIQLLREGACDDGR